MTGIVYKSTGSWYLVKAENGTFYECRIKGKFRLKGIKSTNPIAVGDIVDFEIETNNDVETGVINEIHERKNYIIRNAKKFCTLFWRVILMNLTIAVISYPYYFINNSLCFWKKIPQA